MTNGIIYGIGGLVIGTVYGKMSVKPSTQVFSECMSVPLYNIQTVNQQPTYSDYINRLVFPTSKTGIESHDYWHGCVVTDSSGNYYQMASFHMYNNYHRVWYKNYTTGEYTEQRITDTSQIIWEYTNDIIKITSPLGVVTMNTTTKTATVNVSVGTHTMNLNYSGKPVFYNDRKTLIIVPDNYYLQGFEIIGKVSGTVDNIEVAGTGNFERCNWNFTVEMVPGEKWYGFSIGNGETCGIIYKHGLLNDSGIYINEIYLKPILFNTSTVTYQYSDKKIYPLNQEIHVQLDIGIFRLILTWLGKSGAENAYSASAYINDVYLGDGYAWVEMSGVI